MAASSRSTRLTCAFCSLLLIGVAAGSLKAEPYDPLQTTQRVTSETFTLTDAKRKREIPVRFYLPQEKGPRPVVLFSHGLGGSRDNSGYIGKHLAGRGYVCIYLQHPGSDISIWRGWSAADQKASRESASNPQNWVLRIDDIKAVVGALPEWNAKQGHPLQGRVDTQRIGMSGHSFGALTTLGIVGQQFPMVRRSFAVPEVRAGICYSPSIMKAGNQQRSFSTINRPMLLMTGTKDDTAQGTTAEMRRQVYPAMPTSIDRYELVLDGGTHFAFSENKVRLAGMGDGERNPNHHRVIVALTTAFWDTYLRDDAEAKAWLQGKSPRQVMEKGDAWQFATAN
ncbi:alpha/beta hydrolase family protein [Bremerella alba]|uniref:PET hydrolase/cutinase-like domain-containing protein n=1 Tax=Bremerella alba TaxID=980252 RepID=A0A7V8V8A4_9BACT|nr:dienelactone hydrolase [Bremerella alba]MBA2116778.1 hypothetical protein [Bremerella alba]